MFVADDFKQDLKKMSLDAALKKHDISLQDAVGIMERPNTYKRKRKVNPTGEKYVYHDGRGKFTIRRKINRKSKYFGTYETLEDAVLMRDHLMENGWYKNKVKTYRKELGV